MVNRPPPCPEGRRSSPTTLRNGRRVLDIDTYVPYFLAAVDNALARGASARYRAEFGIGIGEWRVISFLADEPDVQARRICEVIALDKAAVSRSLAQLEQLGHVTATAPHSDPRRRHFRLTPAGQALHDRIMEVALAREARLIEGIDPDDLEAFLRAMRIMRRNVSRL